MKVEVAGQTFTLAAKDLVGSKTINNLLQTPSQTQTATDTADERNVVLTVELDDWRSYLEFLDKRTASVEALKVISYLDNLQQAQRWCESKYFSVISKITPLGDQAIKTARNKISKLVNTFTKYQPAQVMPFRLLTNFQEVLTRIQTVDASDKLSYDDVRLIVLTLFTRDIYYDYLNFANKRDYKADKAVSDHSFILLSDSDSTRLLGSNEATSYNLSHSYVETVNFYSASTATDSTVSSNHHEVQTFSTGLKIKHAGDDYELVCYNKPSTYGRKYQIFLPYNIDLKRKLVCVFSV